MSCASCVLVIAASDSSGGAGLSRDVETLAAFGVRSAVALTAITVQTHEAVHRVAPVEPALLADQIEAAFSANNIKAVKIGLLPTIPTIMETAAALRRHPNIPVILDPVLAASSGGALTDAGIAKALAAELVPLSTITTPNRDELAVLAGAQTAVNDEAVFTQSRTLLKTGAAAVLAKGGHGTGSSSTDHLLLAGQPEIAFNAPRLDTSMRGTGCMLASGIAAGLALGQPLETSVAGAKRFVYARLRAAAKDR